ncbi:MAG: hypothetical protein A2Y76_15910 [Planctomycetes bacterium RBG_13_60_9]|nr:MAG: hypothetical protein A2Y76_15910 [Planctomycetes bacterium RBG_13_60_9]
MKRKTILLAALASAVICIQATADITIDWQNNDYGTYAQWSLSSNTDPPYTGINPDSSPFRNGNGTPSASLYADPTLFYQDQAYGETGIVYGSPVMRIDLDVPNVANEDLWKIVQVELRYHVQTDPDSGYQRSELRPDDSGQVFNDPVWTERQIRTTDYGAWYDLTLEYQLPQLWDGELISIWVNDSGVYLDNIQVASVCVPVPAAVLLGMLGLGVAGLKLRKLV